MQGLSLSSYLNVLYLDFGFPTVGLLITVECICFSGSCEREGDDVVFTERQMEEDKDCISYSAPISPTPPMTPPQSPRPPSAGQHSTT